MNAINARLRHEAPTPQSAEHTELHPELNRAHVRFIGLGKTYNGAQGPVAALQGIDLAIQRGDRTLGAVVGLAQADEAHMGTVELRMQFGVFGASGPVSYTHLTLPTIYSV